MKSCLLIVSMVLIPMAARGEAADPDNSKVEEALDSKTSLEFAETPLKDAMDFIGLLHGVTIDFDEKGLKAAGVDPRTPISASLNDVKLRTALEKILPEKAAFAVEKGKLKITGRKPKKQ